MASRPGIPNRNRKIVERDLAAAQTFQTGALVLLDAGEDIAVVAADPTAVYGISTMPAVGDNSFAHGGIRALDTDKVTIALPGPGRTFLFDGDANPTKSDINQSYGAVDDGNGVWTVDTSEAVALVFYVEDVDLDTNRFEVTIIQSVIVTDP